MAPVFLTLDEVLEIHRDQIARYGGAQGIRDLGLLQSALAQPAAVFGGQFLHADLFEMAAAYLFHLVQNHPLVDGNKRLGWLATATFLEINGISVTHVANDAVYDFVIAVTVGHDEVDEITRSLRQLASR